MEKRLEIDVYKAQRLIVQLLNMGYIATMENGFDESWVLTTKGVQFLQARASKPIKRSTADRVLAEFLERVVELNANPQYCYRVEIALVFGSYINTNNDYLGDLDVAILTDRKEPDLEIHSYRLEQRIQEVENAGRRFSTWLEREFWPMEEVYRFLRKRSRTLSLHDVTRNYEIILSAPRKLVYISGKLRNSLNLLEKSYEIITS